MGAPEDRTQVFIVRFWPEPRELETATPEWRGVVEHVKSGERRFVQRPDEVALFIAAYVTPGGSAATLRSRVGRWLKERWGVRLPMLFSTMASLSMNP